MQAITIFLIGDKIDSLLGDFKFMSTKIKKKPSKTARLAAKMVEDSKLMAAARKANDAQPEQDLNLSASSPRVVNTAKKLRPEKKRG